MNSHNADGPLRGRSILSALQATEMLDNKSKLPAGMSPSGLIH